MRSDGTPIYTLPVIVDPSRNPSAPNIISNTNNIAEYLESTYPARPVFPPGSRAMQTLFVHYVQEVFTKPLLHIIRASRSRFLRDPTANVHGLWSRNNLISLPLFSTRMSEMGTEFAQWEISSRMLILRSVPSCFGLNK
ncbi:hypothetical protein C8J56DRAFT_980040 [Mycena floridula]|nr:hypothetical protein C8J56DRAFT_980040 [Mycena floridula]